MADTVKICLFCGETFKKKKCQSPSKFIRQKYCSKACSTKATNNSPFKKGRLHPNWGDGTHKCGGYIMQNINGIVKRQHIIIMEKFIGRKIDKYECVHHCDMDKANNKISNLELMLKSEHAKLHNIGKKASDKTKKLLKKIRNSTNRKESHPQWKDDVTIDSINIALQKTKTKKEAAKLLGICPDTLRARINYYENR